MIKFLLFIIGLTLVSSEAPSLSEYTRAKEFLKGVLPRGRDLPKAVRLAFHDCVGPDGCDGCLNNDDPSNAGLADIIEKLARHRSRGRQPFTAISNADFWQIAGIAALELANSAVDLTFKGGRVDCAESPGDSADHDYPDPNMNRDEMLDWFLNHPDGFGMDSKQVTALMGAHSLGRATRANSGYNGPWTPTRENEFNNEFYQLLVNENVSFRNRAELATELEDDGETVVVQDYKYQWTLEDEDANRFLMLNTDMELAYDIDVDNFGDGTTCHLIERSRETDINQCEIADTFDLVQTYANDEAAFLADFKEAYEMMMEKGNSDLSVPV